jgi:hypothetical protein
MEDFVYVILAILWLVISIVGNKRKKAQQQQQQQQQAKPTPARQETRQEQDYETTLPKTSEFEVLLDQFFGEDTTKPMKTETLDAPEIDYSPEYTYQESENEPFTYDEIPETEPHKFGGMAAIEDNYEFSAEGNVETIEDLIKSYNDQQRQAEEKDAEIVVVDLDEEEVGEKDWEFDGRKAIIYSEIINRRYT